MLYEVNERRTPYIITQNGEAKAVIQDVVSYEETQETLALLKILALGEQDIQEGKVHRLDEVIAACREIPAVAASRRNFARSGFTPFARCCSSPTASSIASATNKCSFT